MYAKFNHNLLHSSRDRAIFTFFRIWSSAKPRLIKNVSSQSLGLDLVNINVYAKVYQNIPLSLRDFFRICYSAKPRPMINVILQFLVLDLFNIKLSAKFYQNIPNGLIVNFHFFSEFEPWQNIDQSQMSFDNLMGYILSIYQCVCKISSQYSLRSRPFSLFSEFGARQNLGR